MAQKPQEEKINEQDSTESSDEWIDLYKLSEEVKTLSQELEEKEVKIGQKETQLQEKDAEIELKDIEIQEKCSELQEARLEIGRLEEVVIQRNDRLQQAYMKIGEQQMDLDAKDKKLMHESIMLHDPDVTLEWRQCSPVPVVLFESSAVVVGDVVYAGGGRCQRMGTYDKECTTFVYEYQSDIWSSLPLPDNKRHKFALVAFRNHLVLVGGAVPDVKNEYLNTLIEWDHDNHSWAEPYPPMNVPRMQSTAVGYGQYIIVAAGKTMNERKVNSVEVFDVTSHQWHMVAPLPNRFSLGTSTTLNGNWYIMGGDGQDRAVYHVPLESLVRSTPETKAWKSLCNTPHKYATVIAFRNSILAIGGKSVGGATNEVYIYFHARKLWIPVKNFLERPLYSAATVVVPPGELLVVGGCSITHRYEHVFKGTLSRKA